MPHPLESTGGSADRVVQQGGPCGVGTAGTMDCTAWMSRGRGQVEVPDRRFRAGEAGQRAEHELLMDLGSASADVASHEVPVVSLEIDRAHDVAGENSRGESGRESLDALFHPPGEGLDLRFIPAAGDAVRAGVTCGALWHVCLRPH